MNSGLVFHWEELSKSKVIMESILKALKWCYTFISFPEHLTAKNSWWFLSLRNCVRKNEIIRWIESENWGISNLHPNRWYTRNDIVRCWTHFEIQFAISVLFRTFLILFFINRWKMNGHILANDIKKFCLKIINNIILKQYSLREQV